MYSHKSTYYLIMEILYYEIIKKEKCLNWPTRDNIWQEAHSKNIEKFLLKVYNTHERDLKKKPPNSGEGARLI